MTALTERKVLEQRDSGEKRSEPVFADDAGISLLESRKEKSEIYVFEVVPLVWTDSGFEWLRRANRAVISLHIANATIFFTLTRLYIDQGFKNFHGIGDRFMRRKEGKTLLCVAGSSLI